MPLLAHRVAVERREKYYRLWSNTTGSAKKKQRPHREVRTRIVELPTQPA